MKTFILSVSLFFIAFSAKAQSVQDTSLIVNGVCGMCQNTIETAAKEAGVKKAKWDKNTKILSLRYDPAELSLEKISEAIARSGYDTELMTASDSAYQALVPCCLYRDPQTHKDHK